jgi:hypothetical protein
MSTIESEHFAKALSALLEETMDTVEGFFLDQGTSLFKTLESITASEASIPVGGKCATLAAQVKHVAFYFDVVDKSVRDLNYPEVNWGEIWQTVNLVTQDEWEAIKAELRTNYNRILKLISDTPSWQTNQISGAIAIIAHTAYHLGEIRQALCTIKA